MEFLVSKYVGTPLVTFPHPTNSVSDVYSYNFPDDKRFLKALGEYSRSVHVTLIHTDF